MLSTMPIPPRARRPSSPSTAADAFGFPRRLPVGSWSLGWAVLVALGVGMALWAALDARWPGDVAVAQWVQDVDPLGAHALRILRDLGSTVAAAVAFALAVLVISARWGRRAGLTAGAWGLGFALQGALKLATDRPRPGPDLLVQFVGTTSSSFPSGHVMSAVIVGALITWLAVRLPERLPGRLRERRGARIAVRVPLLVWGCGLPLFECWTSVAAGVHWPSDVGGGLVWGAVVVLPGLAALEAQSRRRAGAVAGISSPSP